MSGVPLSLSECVGCSATINRPGLQASSYEGCMWPHGLQPLEEKDGMYYGGRGGGVRGEGQLDNWIIGVPPMNEFRLFWFKTTK